LNTLGELYFQKGEYRKSQNFYERSLKIAENSYSKNNVVIAEILNYLGEIYLYKKEYKNSYDVFKRSVEISLNLLQEEVPYQSLSTRQFFADYIDDFTPEIIYSVSKEIPSFHNLALFLRINRQGLLEEIEKRQSKINLLEGSQKDTSNKLKSIIGELSSVYLTKEKRKILNSNKEELEKNFIVLYPKSSLGLFLLMNWQKKSLKMEY
jgi:tetratricopeptide (TPR) repeat protein